MIKRNVLRLGSFLATRYAPVKTIINAVAYEINEGTWKKNRNKRADATASGTAIK